jgi:hypothetical protein
MVSAMSLWLPILVSAVIVFVASSIIHMFLPFHRGDMKGLPNEADVLTGLRKANIEPGDYVFPYAGSMEAMKTPEYVEKYAKGPVGFLTLGKPGPISMTGPLVLWFLYSVLVSLFAGYVAGAALSPDTHYLQVFRIVGATAFMGYSMGLLQNSIWYRRNWGATCRSFIDGLVYALLTAGTFGWLWPK